MHYRKLEKTIFDVDPIKSKILSIRFMLNRKLASQRIECYGGVGQLECLTDSESPGWKWDNLKFNSKIQNWLIVSKATFLVSFYIFVSKHKILEIPPIFLIYVHWRAATHSALYPFIAEYSKIDRSDSYNINPHTYQLRQIQRIAKFKVTHISL